MKKFPHNLTTKLKVWIVLLQSDTFSLLKVLLLNK